eukprot:Phypoly_transcript_01267.p1 GENE.Phypoly_transcript_01267~~Phypoly_transcript_01267.p1  ORF type:complete len:1049 (+),score=185.29 Phypoly_transcript_01267:344-3490(+)
MNSWHPCPVWTINSLCALLQTVASLIPLLLLPLHPMESPTSVPSDMHYKMSKKIAQLTKVIYQLNSRNDDQQEDLCAIRDLHENEIQYILKEACKKLQEFQEDLAIQNEQIKQSKALEKQQYQHNEEKETFTRQFFQLKEEQIRVHSELEKKYETQILFVTRDLENMQAHFMGKIDEFSQISVLTSTSLQSAVDTLQRSFDEELHKITIMRDNENQQILASEQAKYLQLIEEHKVVQSQSKHMIQELEEHFLQEKNNFHSELVKQTSTQQQNFEGFISDLKANHLEQITQLKKINQQLEDKLDGVNNLLLDATTTIKQLELQVTHEQAASEHLTTNSQSASIEYQAKINYLTAQLENLNSKLFTLENQAQDQLLETTKQHEHFLAQLQSKENKILSLQKDTSHKENKRQHEKILLEQQLDQKKSEMEQLMHKKAQLQAQVTTAKHIITTKLAIFYKDCDKLTDESLIKIATLNNRINQITKVTNSCTVTIESLNQQNTALQQNTTQKQMDLTLINQALGEKDTAIHLLQSELQELHNSINKLVQENHNSHENYELKLQQSHTESQELQGQYLSLQNVVKEKELENLYLKNELITGQLTIESLQNQLIDQKKELESHAANLVSKLQADLTIEWNEKIHLTEKLLIDKLEKKHTQDYTTLHQQKEHDMQLLQQAVEQLLQKNNENGATIQIQLQQIDELKSSIKQMEQSNSILLAQVKEMHTAQITALQEDSISKQLHLEQKYKQLFEAQQKEKNDSIQMTTQEITLYYECKIEEINKIHMQAIADNTAALEAKWKENLLQLEKQNKTKEEAAITNLKKDSSTALETLQEKYRQEQKSLQLALESKIDKIKELEMQMEAYQTQITQSQAELKHLNDILQEKERDFTITRNQLLNEIKESVDTTTKKYEVIIGSLEEQRHLQFQQLTAEFGKSQKILEEKCSFLQQQLQSAECHYQNRSPREQDLELIQSLKNEITTNIQSINKLKLDQKHMKLELHNREENFNKIFNKSPQIGVAQVSKSYDLNNSSITSPKLPPLSARGEKTKNSPKSK